MDREINEVLLIGRAILLIFFTFSFFAHVISSMQQYLKPGEGPIVLVLAPTRELSMQIKEECGKCKFSE